MIQVQESVTKNDDQFKLATDFTTIMNEIAKLLAEIMNIERRSEKYTTLDQVNIELLKFHKEIDDLKNREKVQKIYI